MPDVNLSRLREFIKGLLTVRNGVILGSGFIALMVLIYLFDAVLMPWYTKHGEALAVPNVTARPYDDAKDALERLGLEVVKQGEQHDPNLPFGYVTHQNPRPNRKVKKGRRVYLTISVGEREVEMPNVVGVSETNAEESLKSVGLRIGDREYRYDPNEPPKVVIEQSIPPGSYVRMSQPIDIVVSLGRPVDNVTVPSVFGKRLEEAELLIEKAGLTLGQVRYERNDQLLPNTVIRQSIESGVVVSPRDTVDIVVSTILDRNK